MSWRTYSSIDQQWILMRVMWSKKYLICGINVKKKLKFQRLLKSKEWTKTKASRSSYDRWRMQCIESCCTHAWIAVEPTSNNVANQHLQQTVCETIYRITVWPCNSPCGLQPDRCYRPSGSINFHWSHDHRSYNKIK